MSYLIYLLLFLLRLENLIFFPNFDPKLKYIFYWIKSHLFYNKKWKWCQIGAICTLEMAVPEWFRVFNTNS